MKLDLPRKIKQMRAVKGATLEALGRIVDVKPQTLSHYEFGKSVPSLAMLEKICDACGYKIMIVPKGTKVVTKE